LVPPNTAAVALKIEECPNRTSSNSSINLPEDSDAAACLPPSPPPPHRSSSGGNGNNGSSSAFPPQVSERQQPQQQQPLAKKARLKTTKDDDEDFSIEYRRLEMALAAAKEEYEAAAEEAQTAGNAFVRFRMLRRNQDEEEWRLYQEMIAREDKSRVLFAKRLALCFDMICLKLRHNQPLESCTTLTEYNREAFPEGYSNRMGQALMQNTQVTALTLFPRLMLPSSCGWDSHQALAHIDPTLRFVQTSQRLRHVQIKDAYGDASHKHSFGCTPLETFYALLEAI
jgi:hypothetical protein